jgi:spore germination protein GerM
MKGAPFRDRLILLAFLIILLVFGALVARKYIVSMCSAPVPASVQQKSRPLREVILYFGAKEGGYLVAEGREIDDCLVEKDCIKATIRALLDGPVGDLIPLFPSHAVVRDVSVQDGTAAIDFSRDMAAGHPGGSVSELLTVYGLANTLAVNFPHVRRVQILLEGEPTQTIKGHVDLREPIKADFNFSRPPEGAEKADEDSDHPGSVG